MFAGLLLLGGISALWSWPGDVGEVTSNWMLNAAVLLGSSGLFAVTHPKGKNFVWEAVALLAATGAAFTSHPAFVEPWLMTASPFIVTGTTLFFIMATAYRAQASTTPDPSPSGA